MNKADMWRGGAIIAGVVVIALLILPRLGGGGAGSQVRQLSPLVLPKLNLPESDFSFPDFNWAELTLPNVPTFGALAGYSPASCTCGCEDKQVEFDSTWLDAISEGVTNAYRDLFSSFNVTLPTNVQTLLATGGVRANIRGGKL